MDPQQKLAKYLKKHPTTSYKEFVTATSVDMTLQAFNVHKRRILTGSTKSTLTIEDMELIGEFVESGQKHTGYSDFLKKYPTKKNISAHQFFRTKQVTLQASQDAIDNPMPELLNITPSPRKNGSKGSKNIRANEVTHGYCCKRTEI